MQFTKDEEEKQEVPQNRTLWREGSREGYAEVRRRCREEGVTVGALTLAASYLAQAATVAAPLPSVPLLPSVLVDVPVSVRHHLGLGEEYAGLYITEVTTSADISAGTSLWGLARQLHVQLRARLAAQEHIVFSEAKQRFETGEETWGLAAGVEPQHVVDFLYSNMRGVPFPTHQPWGGR